MSFKLSLGVAFLGLSVLAGCTSAAEESTATEQDLILPFPVEVEGAWRGKWETATSSQWFEGAVFRHDGTFFADVSTGIVCITTPCPTSVRIDGTYHVVGHSLVLASNGPVETIGGDYFTRYELTRSGDALTIEGDGFSNTLELQNSYCAEPVDCEGQGLIHPMCVGGWTCSEQRSCGYSCGIPARD
ncbi:MAG: hypothetical protein KIT84_13315 [Labilithrix sp.]|nr:hypothetical protein [Labilithrix sp.]MCW5811996.1 hypothetical protein [Labilithrix sp.]